MDFDTDTDTDTDFDLDFWNEMLNESGDAFYLFHFITLMGLEPICKSSSLGFAINLCVFKFSYVSCLGVNSKRELQIVSKPSKSNDYN